MDLGYFETSLPVADIGESVAFYEALGFARVEYARDAGAATMIRGDCRLGLFQGHLDPIRPQLIFWQGDVDTLAAEVERNGVPFLRPLKKDSHGGAFMLRDPDGHPLYIIRMTTFYPQYPQHRRAAPTERPEPLVIDHRLGWYEVSLPVAEMPRSVAFYEALGFREVLREPNGTRVTVRNGDCRIGLFQGHLDPARVQLVFWQGDVLALADDVRLAGLEFFRGPSGQSDHVTFMLRDPDGHPLFFIRMPGVVRNDAG
jgi:predicted lactoylglutathione lyase